MKKQRPGSTLAHGSEHEKAHSSWSRRDFLSTSGLLSLGGMMSLAGMPVTAMQANPLLRALSAAECGDRILLLIRLDGGNDGLNMVVPKTNAEYYNIRPTIAIQPADTWALSADFGMPNTMQAIQPMWNAGNMKVIHNVGYPNQNYSHFRSGDIWASSSASDVEVDTGWIGRLLEYQMPAFSEAPPVVPPALQIGVQTNMIFRGAAASMALAISNPTEFYQIASTGQLYNAMPANSTPKELELAYIRSVANSAYRYSETIQQAYSLGLNQGSGYNTDSYLAEQMAIVARLIKGKLGTKVYMVSIGGFDTHANQAEYHPGLMQEIAQAVNAFYSDLNAGGWGDKVVAMTFSEFGRTVFENGGQGTDHGTGSPILVFGNGNGNGFIGTPPNLQNVDVYGDPAFSVDFRSVYGSVLQDWLCVDPTVMDYVIGSDVSPIAGLLPTGTAPIGANDVAALLGHNPKPGAAATILIKYAIKERGVVKLHLMDTAGHILRTFVDDFKEKGSYVFELLPSAYFLSTGEYIYRLDTGGRTFWRRIRL